MSMIFFIDLWKVVHNGINLFDHITKVLVNLKKKKKKNFFLTNAPRRSFIISRQLEYFGLKRDLYDQVISSGEITWQKLKQEYTTKKNCFLIGPERDYHLTEGLNLNLVEKPELAELIINTGPWGDSDVLENYTKILDKLALSKAIMICSNPDKKVIRGEKFMICAGALADYYEKVGGEVKYYGKPHDEIYKYCYSITKTRKKILVIGDSLENDIAGAKNQNLDSILITSGIHREVNNESGVDIKKLDDLMEKKIYPKYFMKSLIF